MKKIFALLSIGALLSAGILIGGCNKGEEEAPTGPAKTAADNQNPDVKAPEPGDMSMSDNPKRMKGQGPG